MKKIIIGMLITLFSLSAVTLSAGGDPHPVLDRCP